MKWFKHDSDANRDAKLEKVLMKYGAEGYGLYWLCLELIAAPIDKANISFELEHDAEILAFRLKIDTLKVDEMMRFFILLGLFETSSATNRITCLKLANRLENSIVKNQQLQEIQELIKKESRTIPDNPGQSRKTPARIDQTRTDQTRTDIKTLSSDFDLFWSIYPKKEGKKKAKQIWESRKLDRISEKIILAVKANIPRWRDPQYIPNPTTWLNGERWNDEIQVKKANNEFAGAI